MTLTVKDSMNAVLIFIYIYFLFTEFGPLL